MKKTNLFNKFGLKSSFVQNFLLFFAVLFIFILSFSLFYNYNSQKVIQSEFVQNACNDANNMASVLDLILQETEMIAHYMSVDATVTNYMLYGDTDIPVGDIKERLSRTIDPYHFIYEYIHSIYVYSENSNNIYSNDNSIPFEKFEDVKWIDEYKSCTFSSILPRAYCENYPLVLSIIRKPDSQLIKGGIIINVKLNALFDFIGNTNPNQQKYIINQNGKIIYHSNARVLFENITDYIDYDINNPTKILNRDGSTYIIGTADSKYNGFKYIVVNKIVDYKNRMLDLTKYTILIVFLFLFASMIMGYIYSAITYKPIDSIIKVIVSPDHRNNLKKFKNSETQYIANTIIHEMQLNEDLRKHIEQQMSNISTLKLYALGMQINPHFINNTINMVHLKLLCEIGIKYPGNDMISSLSKLMQYVLKEKSDMVTIETELHYTKYFINILSCRNNGDINITIAVDDNVSQQAKILKLCAHTILENSFYHGISPRKNQSGNISINISRNDTTLIVTISDDGVGMTPEQLDNLKNRLYNCNSIENSSIGLLNIHQRIKIIFGDEYGITITSEFDNGTTATMTMPYIE